MNAGRLLLTLAAPLLCASSLRAELVNYEMVLVSNAGNAADTSGFGVVSYEYRIGKYEVTLAQYATFLNAVATTDSLGLYVSTMGSSQTIAGISRSGPSGSYAYDVVGPFGDVQIPGATSGNRPITIVSWFNAARFTNWMSNGQPTGSLGRTTTEDGAYALYAAAPGFAPAVNAINPNTGAAPLYRIPTENEWYKAAYHRGAGGAAGYWTYATQSDSPPGNTPGSGLNEANWRHNNLFAVTQANTLNTSQNYLLDGGAFAGSSSAYGTFDQTGSVSEWNDLDGLAGDLRGVRGGDWAGRFASGISSAQREEYSPSYDRGTGFRLAGPVPVPEPSTYCMALAGLACGGYLVRRRRKGGAKVSVTHGGSTVSRSRGDVFHDRLRPCRYDRLGDGGRSGECERPGHRWSLRCRELRVPDHEV